jgi:hypothetical protein
MTIIHWNGADLPDELRALPAGNYALEPAGDLTGLTPEEEEGLVSALASLRAGRGVPHEEVQARLRRRIGS